VRATAAIAPMASGTSGGDVNTSLDSESIPLT